MTVTWNNNASSVEFVRLDELYLTPGAYSVPPKSQRKCESLKPECWTVPTTLLSAYQPDYYYYTYLLINLITIIHTCQTVSDLIRKREPLELYAKRSGPVTQLCQTARLPGSEEETERTNRVPQPRGSLHTNLQRQGKLLEYL